MQERGIAERLPERVAAIRRQGQRNVGVQRLAVHNTERPPENRANANRNHATRQSERQSLVRKVRHENHRHRYQSDQGPGKNLEGKIHRDKRNRDAGQRRQQSRARCYLAQALSDKGTENLDHTVEKTRHQTNLPRPNRIFGFEINRQHDKKQVGEQTDRVNAVGQRRDIVTAGGARQLARLPSVEEVADENRDRRAGKNLAENKTVRQMNQPAAKIDDENELDQVVDHQTEKTVEIFANEPRRIE